MLVPVLYKEKKQEAPKDVVLTAVAGAPELEAGSVMSFSDFVEAKVDGATNMDAQNAIMVATESEADKEFVEIDNVAKTIRGLKATSAPVMLHAYVPASDKFNASAILEFSVTVKPMVQTSATITLDAAMPETLAVGERREILFSTEPAEAASSVEVTCDDEALQVEKVDGKWMLVPVKPSESVIYTLSFPEGGKYTGGSQEGILAITPAAVVSDPADENSEVNIVLGGTLSFSSEGADALKVVAQDVTTTESMPYTFTPTEAKDYTVTVTPVFGETVYTDLSKTYTVKVAEKPLINQIVFKSAASDASSALTSSSYKNQIEKGSEYIKSMSSCSGAYQGVNGIKLGAKSSGGNITFVLSEDIIWDVDKVIIQTVKYNDEETTLKFNSSAAQSVGGELTFTVDDVITQIKLESGKRMYVKSIDIYMAKRAPKTKVELSLTGENNATVLVGENVDGWLSAEVNGEADANALAAVEYSVADGTVVTVENGKISGLKGGKTTVTATIPENNKDYELTSGDVEYNVTVLEAPTITKGDADLTDDASFTLGEVITLTCNTPDAQLSYKLNDGETIDYPADGIKLAAGIYNLTAISTINGKSAQTVVSNITVNKKAPEIGFADAERTVYLSDFVESREITEHEFINRNNLSVVFKSSEPKVASIDENTGDIHFWNKGVTTISAVFAGNDEYEAATVDYTLNVNLTRPAGESFTLSFFVDPNVDFSDTNPGTEVMTSSITDAETIGKVLETGADKVTSFTDIQKIWYNSRGGLRMGSNTSTGKITINLNDTYSITGIKARVVNWKTDIEDASKNPYTKLYINEKSSDRRDDFEDSDLHPTVKWQNRYYDYTEPWKTNSLTLSTHTDYKRIFIDYLDITVEGDGLEAPVPFDEYGNVIPRTSFDGVETDFIRFEHEAGVDIFYRYTGGEAGDPSVKPSKAPARAGEAAETASHPDAEGEPFTKLATDTSVTDKTTGKYYPYGENYEQWQGGVLKVFAQKTAEDGTVQQSPIHTFNLAIPTSVEGIEAEGNGEVEYFNLQGVKVQNPEKGIYIRVQDGKAVKIAK